MKATYYRLGELKITEAGSAFWWEAHTGIGDCHSGRCFIRGSILLLGPAEREEPGYLKREFLESLRGLPPWDRTEYYSSNYSIHDCRSGRKLELAEWAESRTPEIEPPVRADRTGRQAPAGAGPYQLGQHELSRKTDDEWWWKTHSGSGSLREGRCMIGGGILFLLADEKKAPGEPKHAFLERLNQLPPWSETEYYCPNGVLRECKTGQTLVGQEEIGGEVIPPARAASSSPSLPTPSRVSKTDTPPPLPKEDLAESLRSKVHRRMDEVILQYRLRCKSKRSQFAKAAPHFSFHRFPARKWIVWCGALILAALLTLALLRDQWESRERHHKEHKHSDGRHGDH